eukprot:TRINITY_DN7871_c0_g2_i1.p1 TRINITY_DN7871_c0_g2~~TRINITY_DN7871_c0_g2_i1.p1  ORF type:complete len:350 (-),score=37.79 TRINITY_DN7871_c0_g2_i1:634-1683(-)
MPVDRSHPYARCSLEAAGVVTEASPSVANDGVRPTSCSLSDISGEDRIRDVSCLSPDVGGAQSRSNESVTPAQASSGDVCMSRSDTCEFVFDSAHLSRTSISPPQFGDDVHVTQQMDQTFSAGSTADGQDDSMGRLDRDGSVFGRTSLVHEQRRQGDVRDDTRVGSPVDSQMSMPGGASGFGDVSLGRSMPDWFVFGRSQPTDVSLHSLEVHGSMASAHMADVPATPIRPKVARTTSPPPPPPIISNEPEPPLRKAIRRNSEADVRAILLEDPSLATSAFIDHGGELPLNCAARMGSSSRIRELLRENGAEWSDSDIRGHMLTEQDMNPPLHLDFLQYFNGPIVIDFNW